MHDDRVALDRAVNRLDYGAPPMEGEAYCGPGDYGRYLEWLVETCGPRNVARANFKPPMSYEEWREMVDEA